MSKYHINSKGEPGVCRAKRACPFGDLEQDHFSSKEEARVTYETKSDETNKGLNYTAQLLKERESYAENLEAALEEATKKLRNGQMKKEEVKAIRDEIKVATDQLREAVYQRRYWEKQALKYGLLSEDEVSSRFTTQAAKRSNNKYRKTLKTKVTFEKPMSAEMYRLMVSEFGAWSGLPREEAKRLLRDYDKNSGLTRDEYVVSLFQEHHENGKEMVFVDLETTDFHPTMGEIIEIGIVRVNSKGEVLETLDERFDMNEKAREELGTGPVDIHKIYPEDIKGKPKFTDPAVQVRIGALLNDSGVILSAHNASFENEYLNHYLSGYYEVRAPDSYENITNKTEAGPIIDTRNAAMFFGHSLPNTKLESFSQGNGIPYLNSHSALPDADMSMKAFFNFKNSLLSSEVGKRPDLSWKGMPPSKENKSK